VVRPALQYLVDGVDLRDQDTVAVAQEAELTLSDVLPCKHRDAPDLDQAELIVILGAERHASDWVAAARIVVAQSDSDSLDHTDQPRAVHGIRA
jgi:hypothetical protein